MTCKKAIEFISKPVNKCQLFTCYVITKNNPATQKLSLKIQCIYLYIKIGIQAEAVSEVTPGWHLANKMVCIFNCTHSYPLPLYWTLTLADSNFMSIIHSKLFVRVIQSAIHSISSIPAVFIFIFNTNSYFYYTNKFNI